MTKDIVEWGQLLMTDVADRVGLNKESSISLSPITLESESVEDSSNWVGLQYVYETQQNPPTRLQVFFGYPEFNLLPVTGDVMSQVDALSRMEVRQNWLSEYDTHPDELVKAQLLHLTGELEGQGYQVRALPWHHEFFHMEDRDDLAGLKGMFFPILHFHNPENDQVVVVRCEPVMEVKTDETAEN